MRPSPAGMGIKGSREGKRVVLLQFLLVWSCHVRLKTHIRKGLISFLVWLF